MGHTTSQTRSVSVGGLGYEVGMAGSHRDDFPKHFIGDLVPTARGWVIVPPTACPDGHGYGDGGWSVSGNAVPNYCGAWQRRLRNSALGG